MFPPPGATPPPILKYLIFPATKGSQKQRVIKTGNIYSSLYVYIKGGGVHDASTGQGEGRARELMWRRIKPGGGEASLS